MDSQNFCTEDETLALARDIQPPPGDVIAAITSFLTHWLAHHILDNDKRLAKVVLAMDSGQTLEQARQAASHPMEGATKVLIDTLMNTSDCLTLRTVELVREVNARRELEHQAFCCDELITRVTQPMPTAFAARACVSCSIPVVCPRYCWATRPA